MFRSIDSLQKNLFILLLYASAFIGVITDITGATNKTAFYFASDALIMILGMMSLPAIKARLAYISLLIVICIVVNMSYSGASTYSSLNGAREIMMVVLLVIYYNKIFSEGNEDLARQYVEVFKKYGIIFLAAQVPVAIIQFIQYGPTDRVGGTFGNYGSGVLTFSVICMVYYIQTFTKNITQTALVYATLIPLLLNETKISFILIPMLVAFIYFKPRIKNVLLAGFAAAFFFFVFNQYYTHTALDFDDSAAGIFSSDFLDDYLFADMATYDDIPRFTKIILAWQLLSQQTNTLFFGFEYGLFKGGNLVGMSHFAETYQWLLTGTRPYLFFLIMQGGVLLITGFTLLYAHINRFFKRNNNKFKTFLLVIFLLIMFYNDLFRTQNFSIVFFFLLFYANSDMFNQKTEAI